MQRSALNVGVGGGVLASNLGKSECATNPSGDRVWAVVKSILKGPI